MTHDAADLMFQRHTADLGRTRIRLAEWLTQRRKAGSGPTGQGSRYSSWHFSLSLP